MIFKESIITTTLKHDVINSLFTLSQQLLSLNDVAEWGKYVVDFLEECSLGDYFCLFKETNIPLYTKGTQIKTKISQTLLLSSNYAISILSEKNFTAKQKKILNLLQNIVELKCNSNHSTAVSELEVLSNINTNVADGEQRRKSLLHPYPDIIGNSAELVAILEVLDKVAIKDVPVLIQGESGTGKELIARAIHTYSKRATQPYVSENCAAIPEGLLESELFGYKKGAFTGAYQNKVGLFEVANTGTIFLDEVGDMSMAMQKKLLRTLQNGEIRAIGAKTVTHVDVRLIAATNKNLVQSIKENLFREDLYYRLNVVNIVLPALRERGNDILLLFQHFLNQQSEKMNRIIPIVHDDTKQALLKYSWPGNIRELQNEVKRILALLDKDIITPQELSPGILSCCK